AAFAALALAILAGAGAIVGFRGQQEAWRQATFAENSAKQAKAAESQAKGAEERAREARDQALRNQSLSVSFLSRQMVETGNIEAAILLAVEALPKQVGSPDRPYLPEAETALYKALFEYHQNVTFHHEGAVTDAEFDSGGDRIVTSSFDR